MAVSPRRHPAAALRAALPLVLIGLLTLGGCSSSRDGWRSGRIPGVYSRSEGTHRYPARYRVSGSGANARYAVCHKGRNSMALPSAAVDAHLRHGDRFGSCGGRYDSRSHPRHGDRRTDDRDDARRDDRRGRGDEAQGRRDDNDGHGRGRGNGNGNGNGNGRGRGRNG